MAGRLQPAFWGGLFIGVLSALPFISAGNCCCCLWVVSGGALAAYLRQQQTPTPLQASEGALIGLMAGVIGGVVTVLLSIPLQAVTGPIHARMVEWVFSVNPDIPPELRETIERASRDSLNPLSIATSFFFYVVAGLVFGLLGGLLGVALFKRHVPPPPPPPGTIEILPPEA